LVVVMVVIIIRSKD